MGDFQCDITSLRRHTPVSSIVRHHTRLDLERLDDRCLLSGVLPAGSLDPSFALGTGYVLNPNLQTPSATAIQSNGSVLVGSVFNNPFSGTGTDFQITRCTAPVSSTCPSESADRL